ncbi:MAG: redoxin family protein [Phycisphaerae bacterium]|nr:redoxin family protein [Phycisphaerae bacterium]
MTAYAPECIDVAAKSVAMLALVALAGTAMARSSAARRHLVWFLGLLALVALPPASGWLPRWAILPSVLDPATITHRESRIAAIDAGPAHAVQSPGGPGPAAFALAPAGMSPGATPAPAPAMPGQSVGTPVPHDIGLAPATARNAVPVSTAPKPAPAIAPAGTGAPRSWWTYLLVLWVAGGVACLLPPLLGLLSIRRLERRSRILRDGLLVNHLQTAAKRMPISRPLRLLITDECRMPMTWGAWPWRPASILLPREALEWSIERLRVVLLHELAHIKRHDCFTQRIAQIVRAAYWFNPLAWLAVRQVRIESERACDDLVLRTETRSSEYAQCLVELAADHPLRPWVGPGAIAMARHSTLYGRLLAILDPRRNRRGVTVPVLLGAIALVMGIAIPLSALRSAPAEEPGASAVPPQSADLKEPVVATLRGRVITPEGYPRRYMHVGSGFPRGVFSGSNTDRDGNFTLDNVTLDGSTWLAWSQPTCRMGLFRLPTREPAEPLQVTLDSLEGHARGRVVDVQMRGLEGVKVRIRVTTADGLTIISEPQTSGPFGYYECGYVPAAQGTLVEVRTAGDPDIPESPVSRIQLRAGQSRIEMPDLVLPNSPADARVSEPTASVKYGGVVRDPDGRPIENAEVEFSYTPPHGMGVRTTCNQTDSHGRWSCVIPHEIERVWVHVDHPDFVSSRISRIQQPPLERLRDGTAVLEMQRGHRVQGIVQDQAGRPVPDALILTTYYLSYSPSPMAQPIEDAKTARTDAEGRFTTCALPAGSGRLAVYARDFSPQVVLIDVTSDAPKLSITMRPGLTLHGVVVDNQDQPQPGTRIQVGNWQTERECPSLSWAIADEAGRFVLHDVPSAGTFTIRYWTRSMESEWQKPAELDPSRPITLVLHQPYTIRGRVIDAESGEPVTRIELRESGYLDNACSKRAFSQGRVRVLKSGDGSFEHSFERSGVLQIATPDHFPSFLPLNEANESTDPIEVRMERGTPIRGRVVSASGQPVAGAEVAWVREGLRAFITTGRFITNFVEGPERYDTTGDDGTFAFPPSREAWRLIVAHDDGFGQATSTELAAESTIQLQPWATIEGTYRPRGKGVLNASIQAVPAEYSPDHLREGTILWTLETTTDDDGAFRLTHVPPIALRVGLSGYRVLSHAAELTPSPGETLRVALADGGATIRGRLQWPSGLRISQLLTAPDTRGHLAQVVAYPRDDADKDGWFRRSVLAGIENDGRFEINGLPPGNYRIEARIHAPMMPNSCGIPIPIAQSTTDLSIPESPDSTPIDMGTVTLVPTPGPQAGDLFPALTVSGLNGRSFDFMTLRDHVVVIDAWASWCAPCRVQLPALKTLYERYGKSGRVHFLGINADDSADAARAHVSQLAIPWPQIHAPGWGDRNKVFKELGISALPSYWILSRDGHVLGRDVPIDEIEPILERALQ